jgi:hypothetical protein
MLVVGSGDQVSFNTTVGVRWVPLLNEAVYILKGKSWRQEQG